MTVALAETVRGAGLGSKSTDRPDRKAWMGARGWPARLVAAAVVVVLAMGCQLHAAVDVELGDDGAGQLVLTVEADEELSSRAAAQPQDPLDQLADIGRTLPGWVADERSINGGRSVVLVSRFDTPAELEERSAALADALAAPELDPLDGFAVSVEQERVRVTGRAALQPTGEVADFGMDPDEAVDRLSDAVDYRIRVSLPGDVVETTAHERDNGTLTWRVPAGAAVEVVAVSSRPRWQAVTVPALAAALIAAGGLGAWLLIRRRRPPSPAGRAGEHPPSGRVGGGQRD